MLTHFNSAATLATVHTNFAILQICNEKFDSVSRVPHISVNCGHSICSKCIPQVTHCGESDSRDDHDDGSSSSSSSSGNGAPSHCPICNRAFGEFVKNFDAIDALEVAESARSQSQVPSVRSETLRAKASDFKQVAGVDLVIERSRLLFSRDPASELGAGASGVVYVGRLDGTLVAIKSVRSTSDSWTTAERLRRELKLASRLKHPYIVEFRGAAWDDEMRQGTPRNVLLVSELMAGGNLRTALDATQEKGLALESFLQVALQIANGLVYLHDEGLAHRDIKSANILLNEPLIPHTNRLPAGAKSKIADFGLSKYIDKVTGGGTVVQSIMEPGRLEATYAYLAPEAFGGDKTNVIRPDDEEDPRFNDMAKKRDIYAFGILLWEMLTGRIPWAGSSLPDVYVRVCVRGDRPAPGLDNTPVPKHVRRLIEKCWSQSPHKRPSASSIVSKLEKITKKLMDASHSASASASASAAITHVTAGETTAPTPMINQPASYYTARTSSQHQQAHNVQSTLSNGPGNFFQSGKNLSAPSKVQEEVENTAPHQDDVMSDSHQLKISRSHSAANPMRDGSHTFEQDYYRVHPSTSNISNISKAKKSGRSIGINGDDRVLPPSTNLPQAGASYKITAREATAAAIAERRRDGRGAAKNRIIRETSSPALGGPNEGRVMRRDISHQNKVFQYDSDEEMKNFDPDQAYADEVYAAVQEQQSHSQTMNYAKSQVAAVPKVSRSPSAGMAPPRRAPTPVRRAPSPVVRSTTPSQHIHRAISANNLREDLSTGNTHASLPRHVSSQLRETSESEAARRKMNRNTSGRRFERSSSHGPPVAHEKGPFEPRSSQVGEDTMRSGGRNFIRRMHTNDPRPSRNSAKSLVPRSMSVSSQDELKKASTNMDDNNPEVTVMTIGAPPKEDFKGLVSGWSKEELLRNLAKRAHPMRLAGLAHAGLSSSKHNTDEEVLRNACAILHRLTVPSGGGESNDVYAIPAKEQLNIRRFLKNNGGVQALLKALQPPRSRHATTLSYAMLALGNLTAWDLDAHKQFREADGVALVAKVMRTHSKNMGVYEKGCYALACVAAAYSSKMKSVFRRCGAVDVVVSALSCVKQKNVTHDAVTKQACAALGAMCAGCPENAAHAAKSGAITYLIIAFETFRKSSRTETGKRSEMRLVCKAFMDIMCFPENRRVAGAQGGTNLIIRAVRIFRLDADFVEKVLQTLGEFCMVQETAQQVVKISGIDDIVAAMVRFRNLASIQREGGKVLTLLVNSCGDEARRLMLHASGGERLVLALEKFGCGPDANGAVSVELCKALTALCQVESAMDGDVLGKRLRKLKCDKVIKNTILSHKDNQNVQDRGKEALRQVSSLRSSGNFWSRLLSGNGTFIRRGRSGGTNMSVT